jgi:hypothetical protein
VGMRCEKNHQVLRGIESRSDEMGEEPSGSSTYGEAKSFPTFFSVTKPQGGAPLGGGIYHN